MRLTPRQQAAKERYMKRKYAKDLIQPSNPLFKRYYPEQHVMMEKAEHDMEVKSKYEKKQKDEFFKKYKTGVHSQQMRNTLKLEEQIEHGSR